MGGRREFGKVRRLPSGRWQARHRDRAGREVAAPRTFATKGEACRYLSRVQVQLERGEWHDPGLAQVTFSESVSSYMEGSRHKRSTTKARDEVVVKKHFLPPLGRVPLARITPLDIRRIVEGMTLELAPSTIRTNYGVLKTIFSAAVEADLLVKSPCRGVKLPPENRRERPSLGLADLERLANELSPEYAPMVYVAGVLGLRWSEIAALRVRHLDFLRRSVTIAETLAEVSGRLTWATTKSPASQRTLSVPPFLMAMFAEHLSQRCRPSQDDLVFRAPGRGPLRATNFRNRIWAPAVRATGLEDLTFHGLRHVATSLMVDAGEHPRVIQYRLGHFTARLSLEIYAHVSDLADQLVATHLEEMFSKEREQRSTECVGHRI